jgi:hypothetical protein
MVDALSDGRKIRAAHVGVGGAEALVGCIMN